jgi:hypothetical protein
LDEYYKPFVLTELGLQLRQQVIAGAKDGNKYTVDFTRAVIGQGRPAAEDDMYTLTAVVSPVADMPVKESYAEGYNHIIVAVVDNQNILDAIMMTEVGIMARLLNADGTVAQEEILYGYTYTNRYDYLPDPASGYIIQREMLFDTVISRTANVSVTFDASKVYATVQDLRNHIFDINAHTPYPLAFTFNHGLDRYPGALVVEFENGYGMEPYSSNPYLSGPGRQLQSRVEYLDSNNIKVRTDKLYGAVKSVSLSPRNEYILTFVDSTVSVYVILTGVAGYGGGIPPLPEPFLARRAILMSRGMEEEGVLKSEDGDTEDMYVVKG